MVGELGERIRGVEKQDVGMYLYMGALLVVCIGVSPLPGCLTTLALPELQSSMLYMPSMYSLPELPDIPDIPPTLQSGMVSVTEIAMKVVEDVTRVSSDLRDKIAAWPVWHVFDLGDADNNETTSLPIGADEGVDVVTEATRIAAEKVAVLAAKIIAEDDALVAAVETDILATEENNAATEDIIKIAALDEPTLGDVENIDNQAATVMVESVVKAAQDIVVNIIEATKDTPEKPSEATADTSEDGGHGQRIGG
jgi:hypothetical protein